MSTKLERYFRFMPDIYKARTNPMLKALLEAWSGEDEQLETQLKNTNAQLFVRTAEGVFLDRLASNYGVSRPSELGLIDSDFQKLIPNLSLKAKQISKSFYDTMDVFWGPLFSRANISSQNSAPFNVSVGESFSVSVDGKPFVTVTAVIGDIAVNGAATAREMAEILNRIEGITVEIEESVSTGEEFLSLRTNTPGARGSVFIDTAASMPGLGFMAGKKHLVTDLPQRTVLYQVNPGEIILEIPSIVPVLRRTLKGSHHFHADSQIAPPVPPTNGIWQGSFTYSTSEQPFLVTGNKAVLEDTILAGSILNQITVDDAANLPVGGGTLIFNFGKSNQEEGVKYITTPNSKTILIDPGHTFSRTHLVGSSINLQGAEQITPYKPRISGVDLAVYLTSPANARNIVQELLESLSTGGITVKFLILLPEYKYLFFNPYAA